MSSKDSGRHNAIQTLLLQFKADIRSTLRPYLHNNGPNRIISKWPANIITENSDFRDEQPTKPSTTTATSTKWTVPNWPPSSISDQTDEEEEPETTSGIVATSLIPPAEILPHPPTGSSSSNSNGSEHWKVISFIFIGITLILFLVTVALWVIIPKPKITIANCPLQKVYSIPRPTIANTNAN